MGTKISPLAFAKFPATTASFKSASMITTRPRAIFGADRLSPMWHFIKDAGQGGGRRRSPELGGAAGEIFHGAIQRDELHIIFFWYVKAECFAQTDYDIQPIKGIDIDLL